MAAGPSQKIRTISAPPGLVIDLLRRSNEPKQCLDASELYSGLEATGFKLDELIDELCQLGLLSFSGEVLSLERYPIGRILDELALAGALSALCAYQCALRPKAPDYGYLFSIHEAIKAEDPEDPHNLLHGAYLDYQFHLEIVRLSGNKPAHTAYVSAIKPALWLAAANFYALRDVPSSIAEHERMITIMQRRDSLRARDSAAWHVENAIDHIRKAALAQKQSYPAG